MSYETFPWSSIDTPNGIEVNDFVQTIEHDYGVYMPGRPRHTKIHKIFTINWTAMKSESWVALVTFWRSVSGNSDFFYWQFPASIYGVSGWGGELTEDPPAGWDAELSFGWGGGPIFLCKFVDPKLPQKYLTEYPNRWAVTVSIREVG